MTRQFNYNGDPLKDNEVLVLMPYDPADDDNISNRENIVTITRSGKSVKAVLKAVPREFEAMAKAQFNGWVRDQFPNPTEGRCMVPQPDGSMKECPRMRDGRRISCANCPHRGEYDRRVTATVSIEGQMDEHGIALGTAPAAEQDVMAHEEADEARQRIVEKFEAMLNRSPKHALAMALMALGYKGKEFAEMMHLGHAAANDARNKVDSTAPYGISDFDAVNVDGLKANRTGDTEYYRTEALKALDALLEMHL